MSRRRMWKIARSIRLPVSPKTVSPGGCPWDGQVLHGRTESGPRGPESVDDWWHEIGHALIAPEQGWKLRGWGQGWVYDLSPGGPELHEAGFEEDASCLGIWCQLVFGRDPDGAMRHAASHDWNDDRNVDLDGVPVHSCSWQYGLRFFAHALSRERAEQRLRAAALPTPWDDVGP